MVMLHDEDEPHFDETTIKMELQQFLDEWHYRILHSGLALDFDRVKCLELIMDIFELEGMVATPEEKKQMASLEDETEMVNQMVAKMPISARKSFEHFVLQLQLVVSTTTQVRWALEEGNPQKVASCFEGGDSGPGSQILKQCIIEAGKQIHESIHMHKSWKHNTDDRIKRLLLSQDAAEHARQQLTAVQAQLDSFKGDQSSKSKSVLMGMASKNDQQLVHTIFSTWYGWLVRHQLDKEIHDKFKQEIQDAEDALIAFKSKQLHISRSMLTRGAAQGDSGLKAEVLRMWFKYVITEGHSKEMDKRLEEAQARLNNARGAAKDASKAVMGRMCAGNNTTLLDLCVQSWRAELEELKKDKEIDALAKQAEAQYKAFMEKKSGEARGVLDRMSSGSDSGLCHVMLQNWLDYMKEVKKEREMEAIINANNDRFKSLANNQKHNAKNVAHRANELEEENMVMTFFYAWSTDTREQHVIKHYGTKLDAKKNQLDAVQTMFRSFANQLEQGIGNTPRTQRKSAGRSKASGGGSEASGAPPLPPQ